MEEIRKDIEKAVDTLRSGGVILYPTDTIWGLGCDATDGKAVDKVFAIKNRPPEKSMIVLVDSFAMLERYTRDLPAVVYELSEAEPGALTLVLPARKGLLAPQLVSNDGFSAVRICSEQFCIELIGRFRKPVVSTSANLSGEPPPAIFSEIAGDIVRGADYVAEYRRNDTGRARPSPVIRIDTNGVITILRK
ncbi:MAG: threonylcarbamoyl-AMP synthase [Bacteroidetes bacterium]|nr:threonylcarbamoyl-AMP synthase [Bacteroidota bacterium]